MEVTLDKRTIDEIAYKTALILEKRMSKREAPDMITTAEAARILGIGTQRMRQIADRYPHTKKGNGEKQGQLLFVREALLKSIR